MPTTALATFHFDRDDGEQVHVTQVWRCYPGTGPSYASGGDPPESDLESEEFEGDDGKPVDSYGFTEAEWKRYEAAEEKAKWQND